ncbi:nucleotidyltransferase [Pradoshia sp.]
MKAAGLVVEYNPFHNGHQYHLDQSLAYTKADLAVGVMSGNFLQRGEPAIVNKWARTRMALEAGVDLIVELPFVHAVQKAEYFAEAAVLLLEELQCDWVCFGSEQGNIQPFMDTYDLLDEHADFINNHAKHFMDEGHSYPKAMALAYGELKHTHPHMLTLDQPNNILGFHYVSAILKNKLSIQPVTIQRTGSGYHDADLPKNSIASATAIRKELTSEGRLEDVARFLPRTSYEILSDYHEEMNTWHTWEMYWPYVKLKLLTTSPDRLKDIYEMKEGLENRLISAAQTSATFLDFMNKVKTKRYTWTRLQRLLTYLLVNITNDCIPQDLKPTYIRVLGFSQKGREYIQSLKKEKGHLLLTRPAASNDPILAIEQRSANVHASVLPPELWQHVQKREYQPPVILP